MTSEIAEATRLELPSVATVGAIESQIDRFFKAHTDSSLPLLIDMSACMFLEPAALILLIGYLSAREAGGGDTQLALPRSKDVRDFLRIWEFPAAVKDALGRSFKSFVQPADHKYFGENPSVDRAKYAGIVMSTSQGSERLLSNSFFGIRTFFSAQLSSGHVTAAEESSRWKQDHVVSVLNRHLHGLGKRVSSHVVHEALMNAFRHPHASTVQTTTHFRHGTDKDVDGGGHLTIVFWDNGDSLIDTLARAIREARAIRSVEVPRLFAKYQVVTEDEHGKQAPPERLRSDYLPNRDTPPHLLLLATTFPGITRDATARTKSDSDPDVAAEDAVFSMPGMGLYVLTNTAVDVLRGTVSIRTKNYFMNIKSAPKTIDADYKVKIREYGPWFPPFVGNMITARLPLSS